MEAVGEEELEIYLNVNVGQLEYAAAVVVVAGAVLILVRSLFLDQLMTYI